eukprot:TRINITY_DN68031_c2_g1_i1.p1 TRINITY_DN68031_c2_g1~~TRINITY_DN68031_c2_g1_i1.p1  ORF type:complete len:250 (+),score=22.15 TRINITY_DN68031_c2_g1_i1:105-752(+)
MIDVTLSDGEYELPAKPMQIDGKWFGNSVVITNNVLIFAQDHSECGYISVAAPPFHYERAPYHFVFRVKATTNSLKTSKETFTLDVGSYESKETRNIHFSYSEPWVEISDPNYDSMDDDEEGEDEEEEEDAWAPHKPKRFPTDTIPFQVGNLLGVHVCKEDAKQGVIKLTVNKTVVGTIKWTEDDCCDPIDMSGWVKGIAIEPVDITLAELVDAT